MARFGAMIVKDIWQSFLAMPLWVRIWVFVVLVPVNFAPLLFVGEPFWAWVAVLAAGAVAFNALPLLIERGFGPTMALSHVIAWPPLLVLIGMILMDGEGSDIYRLFLWILLIVDGISLVFDVPDSWKWLKGDRKPAGR